MHALESFFLSILGSSTGPLDGLGLGCLRAPALERYKPTTCRGKSEKVAPFCSMKLQNLLDRAEERVRGDTSQSTGPGKPRVAYPTIKCLVIHTFCSITNHCHMYMM